MHRDLGQRYLGYALTISIMHCGQLFSLSCLNETKVHILQLFALNHEIFHVYMQWSTESWIFSLPPQRTPGPFPLAYSLALPHASPQRIQLLRVYLISSKESRSAHQAFCLSDSLPCSLAGWTPLLCWEVLVSIPPLFQPVLYQHKRTHYPSPLINGRAGAGARPAPRKPKWSEREEGEAGLPQLWFWSLSLSPCSAPSLHLLAGSFGDTRLGQAPGTRESGPG